MDIVAAVVSIIGALTVGAMSPGPSFIMVARTAVAVSRSDGLASALGMGVGAVVFAAMALLGLHVVLAAVPWLYMVLKVLGGGYLVYLGYRLVQGAREPLSIARADESPAPRKRARSFFSGIATQLSNPKTAVVYASVFAALLPPEVPLYVALLLPFLIFGVETGWYAIVALALSAPASRTAYLRYKSWVDRAAGGVMAVLGIKLITAVRAG